MFLWRILREEKSSLHLEQVGSKWLEHTTDVPLSSTFSGSCRNVSAMMKEMSWSALINQFLRHVVLKVWFVSWMGILRV